ASKPTSTRSRVTSKALAHDMKFLPIALKMAISATSTLASTNSCVTRTRRSRAASLSSSDGEAMLPPLEIERVRCHRQQDDCPLQSFFPRGLDVQIHQCRANRREQNYAEQNADERPAAA